jgi:hypothetical protein
MPWNDVMHYIAQGVINIDEGLTTIEPGSNIHLAMAELCRLVNELRVKPPEPVTRYHLAGTKQHVIEEIQEHGGAYVLKNWEGSDEEAIARIRDEPREVFVIGECDNRDARGECLGHPEEGPSRRCSLPSPNRRSRRAAKAVGSAS